MARTKNNRRGKKHNAIQNDALVKSWPANSNLGPDDDGAHSSDLHRKADQFFISSEFDQAARLCETLLRKEKENVRALEMLALCKLEMGYVESARKLFEKCIKPDNLSPTVYLYLAQLSESPQESLNHFKTAFDLLKSKLDQLRSDCVKDSSAPTEAADWHKTNHSGLSEKDADPQAHVGRDVHIVHWSAEEAQVRRSCSRALVGMTELYLTDLCFDPSAEEKCLEYLAMATSIDPTDPEPLQTLASVRLSQSQTNAAKEALLLAWSLWRDKSPIQLETDDVTMEEADKEQVLVEDEEQLPPLDARIQWAKLALECEMWSDAIEVLQQCEAEDDENGEVQYLLGLAWHFLGQTRSADTQDTQTTEPVHLDQRIAVGDGLGQAECWIEARECFDTCLQLYNRIGEASSVDNSILNHINELSKELPQCGTQEEEDGANEENKDEEEDWEDASDTEMEI
ncbi:hypothetical protein O181_035668 [Austropuccinia psidii MF-1]|uniref:Assembly chaperone of rpl4 n=1 Tax=Austropuccinia psidii MF-1 TaxID=1389203 RepID=A0A9Q3H8G3_9BASI|nr:hypothetical protein [Austropuccinia psidii MF-1]